MELMRPPKKSMKLTRDEVSNLKERVSKYQTMTDAAIGIGVGREVLIRTIDLRRCSEVTYNKLFQN